MEFWKNMEEAVDTAVKFNLELYKDPYINYMFQVFGKIVVIDFSENGVIGKIWFGSKNGILDAGSGEPENPPNFTVKMTADNYHLFFLGKYNFVAGMAEKKISIRGDMTKGRKIFLENHQKLVTIYIKILKDLGMDYKIF